jgi:hypothetical protein
VKVRCRCHNALRHASFFCSRRKVGASRRPILTADHDRLSVLGLAAMNSGTVLSNQIEWT